MSETLINLIIQLVAGAIGGNRAGAALKNLNLGTTLVPHSKYDCITLDSLHNANLATIPTVGRKSLPLFDGLTGRDTLQNGTIENKRKPGSVELVNSVAPPTPAEHAILEAAIQMDLITPEQAEALVEKGKTLGEWLVEKEKGKAVEARNVEQRMLDALAVLALLLRSVDGLRMDRFTDREVAVVSDRTPSLPDTVALRLAHTEDSEAGASGHTRERYNLLTGTSLMFGSILRCPRLSMIQGWSRYGGNSSAAVLGNRTCCCSTETVRPVGGRARIRSDRTEYPSIVLHLPRNRWVRC